MATEAAPATSRSAAPTRVGPVFAGLMLAMLLASLDQTIVATALPTIVGELGGLDQLSWVVTAYLLASTVSTPIYGKLGDLFGRKPIFLFAIVVFLVGSALCGLSQNMGELIAFRAAAGHRRRRADGRRPGDHRRRRPAARARPLPGLLRRRVRLRQRSPARCSAASSPTTSAGAGSSTSTCRSASSPSPSSPWCCARPPPRRPTASTTSAPRCSPQPWSSAWCC